MSHSEGRPRTSSSRERELERKRREWKIEQERAREHERRKQKMIREYEERRARELALKSRSGRSSNQSSSRNRSHTRSQTHSGSRSLSPPSSCIESNKSDSRVKKNLVMSQKLDSSSSNSKLFKGPEGTKIPISDLRKIKVDIRRNIDAPEKMNELQRDIIDPEDVKLKRRDGEGAKPIFEREELKQSEKTSKNEVEEHRTVVTIDAASFSNRRTSPSTPERRRRARSPRRDSRHETSRSLIETSTHHRKSDYSRERGRDERDKERSRDRYDSREHRSPGPSRREHTRRRSASEEHIDRRRSRRDSTGHEHDRYDDRDRRYVDDDIRTRRIEIRPHYLQPVPVPFYYENYARPIMVDPMMPIRGPMGMGRGRVPPMMGIIRPPYPPRFIPPVVFRSRGPPNGRY